MASGDVIGAPWVIKLKSEEIFASAELCGIEAGSGPTCALPWQPLQPPPI
ncbi:MAG: hypothetical protein JKY19_11840 [Alcanivoracaceae bacterium]|nr:hypothetical protein [Alcanivoracaceae bacterium]